MSSRQLRKLQQRNTEQARLREQKPPKEEDQEEEEEKEEATFNRPSLFANFAALQGDEDGDEGDSEHSDGEASDQEDDVELQPIVNKEVDPSPISASKANKSKKKKKKKKKGKNVENKNAVLGVSKPGVGGGTDDIDAALRELNINVATGENKSSDSDKIPNAEFLRACEVLKVNTQQLKVANEMRNLFGRTNLEDPRGEAARGGRRAPRAAQQQANLETVLKGNHAPGKGLPELTLRRNIFVQGKEEWPRAPTGGLTMATEANENVNVSSVVFRFIHNKAYETVQQQFNLFVEIGDPQNLVGLLQRNPYHISSLLQVSKIAKDQGDHALSSDLIERALFTFGRAAQSLFSSKLAKGQARLDFSRFENRELWLAGYHYIRSLMMKGTYRTALEWAKLLLALDPFEDPYCMSLMIHHLAIRAHEFQYLLDFTDREIFYRKEYHISPSIALAALQLKEAARCRSELQRSIETFPWLFCKLIQELNLDGPPPSIWGIVPRTDAEALFTEIYVRQTKDLWNTPEATALLMEVAHGMEKVRQEDVARVSNMDVDLGVARFVYLDNTPTLMALVPSHLLHKMPTSDSDPLPPRDPHRFSYGENRQEAGGSLGDDIALQLRATIESELESDGTTTSDARSEGESESEGGFRPWRIFYRAIFGRRALAELAENVDEENAEHQGHERP